MILFSKCLFSIFSKIKDGVNFSVTQWLKNPPRTFFRCSLLGLFTVSWKSPHVTGRLIGAAAVAAGGCRGARPSVLCFSQPGLAWSPHTFPSQRPGDNGGGEGGHLIGTNRDVDQDECGFQGHIRAGL